MDEFGDRTSIRPRRWCVNLALSLVWGTICAWPYARWFASPSLFDDDFLRVGSLRRLTLGEALFRPFNEHMAPLFEVVSWIAWRTSGRDLLTLPLAFQVSSYLAFLSTLALLAAVAGRELRSRTATLVCVSAFALSSVSAETVLWFSASSFEWSAAAMLGAWYCAGRAGDSSAMRNRIGWLVGSSLASLVAPAFSAIGILAGPLAMLRSVSKVDRSATPARWIVWSLAPVAGTGLYLLICQWFAYGTVLASSVQRNLDLEAACWATLEAPAAVLVPALFGQDVLIRRVPGLVLATLSLAGLLVGLVVSIRSRSRPLILTALALIAGGYLATYATRARAGDLSIFEIQRYHLFPQIGLSLLLGAIARPLIRRFDRSVTSSLLLAVGLAGLLAMAQLPRMKAASDRNFRFPEQPRALASALRLEAVCNREGITLLQAMTAIESTQTPWFPRSGSFHPDFFLFAAGPSVACVTDAEVRPTLLASLSSEDREAIFGGLNAARYRWTGGFPGGRAEAIDTRLVGSARMVATGPNQYRASGRGSWLEFEVSPTPHRVRALVLSELNAAKDVEIWWAGEDGVWSFYRSVRWTPDPGRSGVVQGIALDRLPHWRPGFVRRLRLIFREWGPVTVENPLLVP